MDRQIVLKIISAVVGLALVGCGAWLISAEHDHAEAILFAGLSILGGVGTIALPRLTEERPPSSRPSGRGGRRTPPLPVLLVAIAVTAILASACSPSQLAMQGRAGIVTTSAVHVGSAATTEARSAALDRVEAEHPTDPEHDQALLEEAARWRPVGQAFDQAKEALGAWHDALDLARAAGDDTLSLMSILPLARRVLVLYARAAAMARELGVDLPELPPWVLALFPGGAS